MAFSVFMTFSKTMNNSELAANLADLLEGPSIGPERAISRQSAAALHARLCQQNPANVGGLGADPKDKTKGGSYAHRIRATYLAKR